MIKVTNKVLKRRGLALIAVLWIVVLITIIVTVIAKTSLIDTRITLVTAEQVRADWACRAGMETAIAILNDDDREYDSFIDLWYDNPTDFNDIELDQAFFTVNVTDEAGKLNINTASKEQLLTLPYMTEEIVDSIVDWRDSDDTISQGGAEAGYYLNLPNGYQIRNANFKTMRELLLVKDITYELLYGSDEHYGWINSLTCYSYDTDKDATDTEKVNVNSANENDLSTNLEISRQQARWIVENRSYNSIGDLLKDNAPKEPRSSSGGRGQSQQIDRQTFFQIVDRITTGGEGETAGRVNLNTASKIVLMAVFENNHDLVDEIITYRESSEAGFTGLSGLGEISSLSNSDIRKYLNLLSVRSGVYTLSSQALVTATGALTTVEAVVDRNQSPVEILYYHSGVNN